MDNIKKENRIYTISLILLAFFAIIFVATMGYLNYRTAAIELEEKVIARVEKDNVDVLETAINFGKSFENYYGMEDIFESFSEQYPGPVPFVIDAGGNLMYTGETDGEIDASDRIVSFLESKEFGRILEELPYRDGKPIKSGNWNAVFTNINQDDEVIGYFGCLYQNSVFGSSFDDLNVKMILLTLIMAGAEFFVIIFFILYIKQKNAFVDHERKSDRNIKKVAAIGILTIGILILSGASLFIYQNDYRNRMENSIKISLKSLENQIQHVREQGVNLKEVEGLQDYIRDRIASLETLHAVRITERISEVKRTNEESDIITFVFGADDTKSALYLEAEISDSMIGREMTNIIMVLLSTMIILIIFVFELNNIMDLSTEKVRNKDVIDTFSEKQVSLSLRLTGFLCSTAEYMCVPYAAMMIRDSGEALFGLSVGMTAALPLTVESLMQMVGMLTLPKIVKKTDVKIVLMVSTIGMIICNVTAFALGGALTIVICRALAGYAYAGFKQVSNFLITRGYETEKGRSDNISQDNAGLLAGATCGAGLGAILSANAGYAMTFFISGILFVFYLLGTGFLVPWKQLEKHAKAAEEEKPISLPGIIKMFTSFEMIFFIIVIAIPLNIGVMLCVTLIPAICQVNGISSVMLSYCYIMNGLAGIYIGPALVSKAKAKFGLQPCIAFTFAITAVSIFILHLPPIAVMIIITSMVLGFLDGFGTPIVTDKFMSLHVVESEVDESTSLIFFVILSYILLTFAPMIAEMMLLPGQGIFNPMMIGAIVYGIAAVLLIFIRIGTKGRS